MSSELRLIVGLGNPTPRYQHTRHNVGRDVIDILAEGAKLSFSKNRLAETVPLDWLAESNGHPELIGAKLSCFMNESGGPVRQLMEKKYLKPDQVLVMLDDFMIPFGTLRLRAGGSSGGHNGLASILETLGTNQIPRLRIGVGPVPAGRDPADFVLDRFSKYEQNELPKIFEAARASLCCVVQNGLAAAMNAINRNHLA